MASIVGADTRVSDWLIQSGIIKEDEPVLEVTIRIAINDVVTATVKRYVSNFTGGQLSGEVEWVEKLLKAKE